MKIFSLLPTLFITFSGIAHAENWPHFLGPNHDLHSGETGLIKDLSQGLDVLWEMERGEGHAAPVVLGDFLVLIHQKKNQEIVECLDAATGKSRWRHAYEVDIGQNYGVSDAPRSSPVIDPETKTVFTFGNDGDLIAFNLETGEIRWQMEVDKAIGPAPTFFGRGSCPLVFGDQLIVNVGAPGASVVSLKISTGEVNWKADHEWNASYASPVPGIVNGEDRIFVFAGGMVDPPNGGLLSINPKNGEIDGAVPWRSDMFASVNAASPIPCGPNRVFITEDYGKGGAMIEFDADFKPHLIWEAPELSCQFQTPIYHEGYLYGFGGTGGLLLCYEAKTGHLRWSEPFIRVTVPWDGRDLAVNFGRGNLVHADGAFLCLGENGTLAWMDLSPTTGARILSATQLFYAPETWAAPVISNGRLYVNQSELGSRLICYRFKAE
ncbi:MAG: PQQ-binding-like beta-propeller repeat protein [Verrucomicrobiae bacterium]|nr:PQQ-binding-like beta-propeller repeat protein [Verrucomicrobiae bacterium]